MVFLYFYDLRFRRYLDPLSYTFSSGKLANGWGESGKNCHKRFSTDLCSNRTQKTPQKVFTLKILRTNSVAP